MENTEELYQALRNADKAGDTEAATRLAGYIQSLGTAQSPPTASPKEMLEQLQPTAPPTPEALPKGNPITGALGTAVGLGQNLGAGLIGQVASLPTAALNIGTPSTAAEDVASQVAKKYSREPATQKEQEYTQSVGGTLGSLPPIMGENLGIVAPAARQASGVASGIAGKVAPAISEGAAALTRKVLPTPSPQSLALARKAQAFGIDLQPDMLYNNKFAKILGQAFEEAPLSGSGKEARMEAFNRSLIKQIGGDSKATRLTPDIYEQAMNKYGSIGDEIAERTPVNIGNRGFHDRISQFSNDLAKATPDDQKVVVAYANDLVSQAQNGVVPGVAMKKLTSQLKTQIRGTSNGDLRQQLTNFKNILDGELMLNMNKKDRAAYRDAQMKYAKGMTLEPLVAKATGTEGNISPALLMGQVAKGQGKRRLARGTSGDMGDIAAIGQRFLKEPGSSLTAERNLVYGGMPGLVKWLGAVGPANLYNRLGPSISRAITEAPSPSRTSPGALRGALSSLGASAPALAGGALAQLGGPAPGLASRTALPMLHPEAARMLQAREED